LPCRVAWPGSAACHGRGDDDLVAVLEGRIGATQETDVLAVDVDVDEAMGPALVVEDALTDGRKLAAEVLDRVADRGGLDLDDAPAVGPLPQSSGKSYCYCHLIFSPFSPGVRSLNDVRRIL
jgi:hypothetical protein